MLSHPLQFRGVRHFLASLRTLCCRPARGLRLRNTRVDVPSSRNRPRLRSRSNALEPLEQRVLLTLNVGLSSGNLLIQETSAGDDNLTLNFDSGNQEFVFHDPTRTLTTNINSATGDGTNTIRVPVSKVNGDSIRVFTGANSDSVIVSAGFAPGSSWSLVIDTGSDADSVRWSSDSRLAAIDVTTESTEIDVATVKATAAQTWSTTLNLQNSVELTGSGITLSGVQAGSKNFTVTDSGLVSISGKITALENAIISVTGGSGITVASGSEITSELGSITLNAPLRQGSAGNVPGIRIEDSLIKTGGGNLTITGETTAAASGTAAVLLRGAQLSAAGSGTLVVTGTAANTAAASGVDAGSGVKQTTIITHNGHVIVTGLSGTSGSYPGTLLEGVLISSTGSGNITVTGDSKSSGLGLLIDNGSDIDARGSGSVSLGGSGTSSPGSTITFDGLDGTTSSPWIEKGLRFESASSFRGNRPHDTVGSTADVGFVDVTSTDGRAFNVFSMDVSEINGSIGPRTIHFTGFLMTGGTVEQSYTTDSKFERDNVQLTGFFNLSKLRFTFDSTTWDDIEFAFVDDGPVTVGNAAVRAAAGNVAFNSSHVKLLGTLTADLMGEVVWSQEFTGPGQLRQIGTGTLTLAAASSHTGGTVAHKGRLHVSGSLISAVTVENASTFSGSGQLYDGLEILTGGSLEPGGTPGILTAGLLTLRADSTTTMDIGGRQPGNSTGNHDQLSIRETVTLGGDLILRITDGYQSAVGDELTLIDNKGSKAVSGTFRGMAQDSEFTLDGRTWKITYTGGSGNDVVIICVGQQYTVSNLNASGSGSLRQAILDANASAGFNVIVFTVAGLIEITSSHNLPVITDPVRIDGTTAPGFNGSPVIEISGASAGSASGVIFGAGSDGSNLRGISIVRFAKAGVEINAPDVVVSGNWIGVTRAGAAAGNGTGQGPSAAGVLINANNPRIGGDQTGDTNVISGNSGSGITIEGGSGALIIGNRIGTNAAGTAALANLGHGVLISNAPRVTVGGSSVAARNLISGNSGAGVRVSGAQSTEVVIQGNYIGISAAGNNGIGNQTGGITVDAGVIGTIIGVPGAGNLVSANAAHGIRLDNTRGTVISANYIGTTADGNFALQNRSSGIIIASGAQGVLVGTNGDGTSDAAEGNLISGNEHHGVTITGTETQQNTVAGNLIGINAAGTERLGNFITGVLISGGAHHNTIGTNNSDDSHNAAEANLVLGIQDLITIHDSSDNVVAGNKLGINQSATQQFSSYIGIGISGASRRNRIGTDGLGSNNWRERNIIGGDSTGRIVISGSEVSDNRISGNYIGLNPEGTGSLGYNNRGIVITDGAKRTLIGSDGDGNGDEDERNILVGHGAAVEVTGLGTSGTVIAGNYFGLSASGSARIGNISAITVSGTASATRIGTDGSNDAFNIYERNVIAGSGTGSGIVLRRTNNVVIAGNYIGLNAAGTAAMKNTVGITVTDYSTDIRIGTNADGIADDLEGNLVSGNQTGMSIGTWSDMSISTADELISGSIPSTSYSRTVAQADVVSISSARTNSWNSDHVLPGPRANHFAFVATGTIEVSTAGSYSFALTSDRGGRLKLNGNTVAEDPGHHSDSATMYATVNLAVGTHQLEWMGFDDFSGAGFEVSVAVGADKTGEISAANGWKVLGDSQPHAGIRLDGNLNVTAWYMNTVNANTVIAGNRVGVAADGLTRLANDHQGIYVFANATRIGGSAAAERNIISGNDGAGVVLAGWGNESSGLLVAGNYIGVGADGTTDVGNAGSGIEVFAPNAVIGGLRTGDGPMLSGPGNLISGNQQRGINVIAGAVDVRITGNFIGTNRDGTAAVRNEAEGILLGGTAAVVGGGSSSLANLISGNKLEGIRITGSQNQISGNLIGTNLRGTASLPNTGSAGVFVDDADQNIIGVRLDGVTDSTEGNLISGNFAHGVLIRSADDTVVAGNRIGTAASGTTALANGGHGILINQSSSQTLIGGSTAESRNLISGHSLSGVAFVGAGTGNLVQGNYIGTDASGSQTLGNASSTTRAAGIHISDAGSSGVLVGTNSDGENDAAEGNLISGNHQAGILVEGTHSTSGGHIIAGNLIGVVPGAGKALGNRGPGIWLLNSGNNRIGSNGDQVRDTAEMNIISGNSNPTAADASQFAPGILVQDSTAGDGLATLGNVIAGNAIGTDEAGLRPLPNQGHGISVISASQTLIGLPATGNLVRFNSAAGIRITGTAENGTLTSKVTRLSSNSFQSNSGLPVDIGSEGLTLNSSAGSDPQFPIFESASISAGTMTLTGFAPAGAAIELYLNAGRAGQQFGDGVTPLLRLVEGSTADLDPTSGTYGPTVRGVTVSNAEISQNRFRFEFPLPEGVNDGLLLTGLLSEPVSEFSTLIIAGEQGSAVPPEITFDLSSTPVRINEGETLDVDGAFYDPDSRSWTATVDYGDGRGPQPLALNDSREFELAYRYDTPGTWTVTVRVTDNGLAVGTGTFDVVVANLNPVVDFSTFTLSSKVTEGGTAVLTGSFTDGLGPHVVDITWGDGSQSSLQLASGVYSFSTTHLYSDDSNAGGAATAADVYAVQVTVRDASSSTGTSSPDGLLLVEVANQQPASGTLQFNGTAVAPGGTVTVSEGSPLTISGSFTDPGVPDVHTVRLDWGDGTKSETLLTPGTRVFTGLSDFSHTYTNNSETGTWTLTLELLDDDQPAEPIRLSWTVAVQDVAPAAVVVNAVPATIGEAGTVEISGTFTDPGVQDRHQIRVIWGDGSPDSVFNPAPGERTFGGAALRHRYEDNRPDATAWPIQVVVSDLSVPAAAATGSTSVLVNNLAPAVGTLTVRREDGSIGPVTEGELVIVSGSFTDPSPADRHQVTVSWGDGNTTQASVDAISRTFTARYRYRDNFAAAQITATVIDGRFSGTTFLPDGGTATSPAVSQTVVNAAPTARIAPLPGSTPATTRVVAEVTDPGLDDLPVLQYRWEFDNGAGYTLLGTASSLTFDSTAMNSPLIRLTVSDDDGGSDQYLVVAVFGTDAAETISVTTSGYSIVSGSGGGPGDIGNVGGGSRWANRILVLGFGGSDLLDASALPEDYLAILDGGQQQDYLLGGYGADIFYPNDGNDSVDGGAGSDRFFLSPNSTLTVIDTVGDNILDFSRTEFGDASGIEFDLSMIRSTGLPDADLDAQIVSTAGGTSHIIAAFGNFTTLVGSAYGDTLTATSGSVIDGGAGKDTLHVPGGTTDATISGGADNDVLLTSGSDIFNLTFSGDDGLDQLINLGTLSGLNFGGGADEDILENRGNILGTLVFGGDDGVDILANTGTIDRLVFSGGADNDIFINNGTAQTLLNFGGDNDLLLAGVGAIGELVFGGDSGADIFANLGSITTLTFNGGADDDVFVNVGALTSLNFGGDEDVQLSNTSGVGSIGTLIFSGDDGSDLLQNFGTLGTLTFSGGADDDLLRNEVGAILGNLNFGGDSGADSLVNLGALTSMTFTGGADNDTLLNAAGASIFNLVFSGDDGSDILQNLGSATTITFGGGADDDVFLNLGSVSTSLSFGGDDGADLLRNSGSIASLSFGGGADDDVLLNLSGGSITTLGFGGDDGIDSLQNTGTVSNLVFAGGADGDRLINDSTAVITTLFFGGNYESDGVGGWQPLPSAGDDGADLLLNNGSILNLTFRGGADDDTLLNQTGAIISALNFSGDDGADVLRNFGTAANLTFGGGADNDTLVNSGIITGTLVFGGDQQLDPAGSLEPLPIGSDDGADVLVNTGSTQGIVFSGGADNDVLLNLLGATVTGSLNFSGDDGADLLRNEGSVGTLIFSGGADDDTLVNTASGLSEISFSGDSGIDTLYNEGALTTLVFTGGADNDLLLNTGSGITTLQFTGGADDDVLRNSGSAISELIFTGDDGTDILQNTGDAVASLRFAGGADDDVLINSGAQLGTLIFGGDIDPVSGLPVAGTNKGSDTLILRGSGSGAASAVVIFQGDDGADAFLSAASGFSSITFNGGADNDVLQNTASAIGSLVFSGGADNDVLQNSGSALSSLVFTGDSGSDSLYNSGTAITQLVFNGGADDDILVNSGASLSDLVFNGDSGADVLFNTGASLTGLTFSGGADDDTLLNTGAQLTQLVFTGDAGNDRLLNRSTGVNSADLSFDGGSGNDQLFNEAGGVSGLVFVGGSGDDALVNSGVNLSDLVFTGGADDDALLNMASGAVLSLSFSGGADADVLQNSGTVLDLIFGGGADQDTLVNLGVVSSLNFMGDGLVNSGGALEPIASPADDGVDTLANYGTVTTLIFSGGADNDVLVNNGPVISLTFSGGADDDTLQNNGPVTSIVFIGGADDDTLISNADGLSTLVFSGDDGVDSLINNASNISSLVFSGGAGADTLRIHGSGIGQVEFDGGSDFAADTFNYSGVGAPGSHVSFSGGPGVDVLAWRGSADSLTFTAGAGDDILLLAGSGQLNIDGGSGSDAVYFIGDPQASVSLTEQFSGPDDNSSDTLDFSSFTAGGIQIDLRSTATQTLSATLSLTLSDGMGMENVTGSSASDIIRGNDRNNRLHGAQYSSGYGSVTAGSRGATQWVLFDFDSRTDTTAGEREYTAAERLAIKTRVESVYRGPDFNAPWFDVRVAFSTSEIPDGVADYAVIYFNDTPAFGRPGGLASEIDPGNLNLGGTAVVQVNGLLGGVITEADLGGEGGDIGGDKGYRPEFGDEQIGADKPAATSENFVLLSAKIAAHELAHLMGLRHQDSFGPIGFGVHDPPGVDGYNPIFPGPAGGVETFDHLLGTGASVGTTRFNDLRDLFFGEREAAKLALTQSDLSRTVVAESSSPHRDHTSAQVLTLATLAVPNTLGSGLNQDKNLHVQMLSILGEISVDSTTGKSESDWYSFSGAAGDIFNLDLYSNSLIRYGTGTDDYIDSIVRIWYVSGGVLTLVPWFSATAVNDDTFEPTDSSIVDLMLPITGTYFIEVDTFARDPGSSVFDPSDPSSPLNPDNPNNILGYPDLLKRFLDTQADTDVGHYQLVFSRFSAANEADGNNTILGFGGIDMIRGGLDNGFSLNSGNTHVFNIIGTSPGSGYNHTVVTGPVSLGGATLVVNYSTFSVPEGSGYLLIDNDGSDEVIGRFAGLPDGAVISENFAGSGRTARISYRAGDGNDVVIIVDQAAPTVTFTGGAGAEMQLRLVENTLQVLLNGLVQNAVVADGIRRINISGQTGLNDVLRLDFSGDNAPLPDTLQSMTINLGGDESDDLIINADARNVVLNHTAAGTGTATVGPLLLNYAGLGSNTLVIENTADLTINFGGSTDNIVFSDHATTGVTQIAGTGLTTTQFANPSSSLVIDLGSGSNSLTINGLDDSFNPAGGLTIQGGSGDNTVAIASLGATFNGTLTISGGGGDDLAVFSGDLTVAALDVQTELAEIQGVSLSTTGGDISFSGDFTLSGSASSLLSNGGQISLGGTVDGETAGTQSLTLNAGNVGTVSVPGPIGGTTPLGTLTLANSGGATFGTLETDIIHVSTAVNILNSGSGSDVRFSGRLVAGALSTGTGPFDLFITGNNSELGTTNLLNSGVLALGDSSGDTLRFHGALNASNQSGIQLFARILTEAQPVALGGSSTHIQLHAATTSIDTTDNGNSLYSDGASITLSGPVNGLTASGSENFELNAGNTGDVSLLQDVGSARRIGTLLVHNARDAAFPNVTAERLVQVTGAGTTTLRGTINTNSTSSTHPGLSTNVGDISSANPNPSLSLPLASRIVNLGVDISTASVVVDSQINTVAGGVRLQATKGTGGVVTFNNSGEINSDLDVILEANATTTPAIFISALATARLGAPGEDVVVGTRRRFLTTSDADVEFRGSVSMSAGAQHQYADIFFVDTGSGAGNITFTGAVDLNLSDLDVRSGRGNINFRGAVSEVHRLFLQESGEGTLEGSTPTTVTFVDNLSTELLITAPGPYNVDLLGSVSTINLNQIQYYLPGNTTFRNTGRVTLGNQSTDRVSVIYGLSTTAASVTNIAGTVDAGYGMSLSPVMLTPAGTTARLQGPSWWTISVAADTSGNSVSQAGGNTLILGAATSRQNYHFSGGITAQELVTTQSNSQYDVAIHGPLTIRGTTGTTFSNRGELRIGGASTHVHQLAGSLTVDSNTSMTFSGQLTAAGDVLITPRLSVQGAGPARIAATGGGLSISDTVLADGVNLTLGSAATASITTTSITGAVGPATTSITFQSAGAVTVGGVIGGELSDVLVVNATTADFQNTVVSQGTVQILGAAVTVTFEAQVHAASFTADAGAAPYNLRFLGNAVVTGAGSLSNAGSVTLGDGADTLRFGSFIRSGGATQLFADFLTANGAVAIDETLTVTGQSMLRAGNAAITLNDVVLGSGVTLDLGTGGSGDISLATVGVASAATGTRLRLSSTGTTSVSGTITGLTALELNEGTAIFSDAIGTPELRIGAISRGSNAGTTTFSENLYATLFSGTGGLLNFFGPVTDVTSAVLSTTSAVVLGNGGDVLNFPAGLTHTTGPTTINGTVSTSNSHISLGNVTVVGTVSISTGTGPGNIEVSAVSGSGSLSLLSGQGHVVFRSTISGLTNLSIQQAADVDFRNTVTLSGNLTQSTVPGTGTTTLRGGAIGGTIDLRAVAISLATGTLTSTGAVSLTGSGSVALAAGTILDAGSSTVRISAGAGGFAQHSGSQITSGSSDPTAAIQLLVNGGTATLGGLTASHASGRIVVTISGTGSILDGNDTAAGTAINTAATTVALSAANGTIGTAANPLEYSRGTVSTPVNAATSVFLRDASSNSGTVIGRYDFGRSTVVQDRFLGVSSATLFSATAAYGRTGSYGFVTRPSEVQRSTTGLGKNSINLYSDSVVGTNSVTYRVRLPSNSTGPYQVRAYFGDRDITTNTVITGLSGTSITSGSLSSGSTAPKAFPIAVATVSDTDADGILTLQFARPTGFTGFWSVIGLDIATGTLPDAAPQLLAGLDFAAGGALTEQSQAHLASVERRGQVLSEELILEVREQVLAAWATTGLSSDAMARLQSATVVIRDLNDRGMLGASGAAGTSEIWLDDDALGYGWYLTDEADGDVPAGTVDLATVMAHEYGHLLGWQDLDPEQYSGHLMAGELAVGERRGVETLAIEGRSQGADLADAVVPTRAVAVPLFGEAAAAAGAVVVREEREAAAADPVEQASVPNERRLSPAERVLEGARRGESKGSGVEEVGHDLSVLDDLFADLNGLL